jgi:hypothetical protein
MTEGFELGGSGDRFFPVRGRPRRARRGDTVFFSHRGEIVGRSRLRDIRPVDEDDNMWYLEQGSPRDPESYYYLCVGPVKRVRNGPNYLGRVGIRYIDNLRNAPLKRRLSELVL